ncbi:GlxA family transcriptional regulator [Parasedimentitalea huanghaiensis]|uniref:Helix-turn-helix domain-containing protein n=1 Tax=Parasedimentitalea huanghaiensis TaxID=2682100 RepID=A0A6L6WP28_9RHOB|nr:GlxA family transcriptional regulator [Zongyanglinia huanghaiensis]MVO17372.1 helix-turn-helix domain-containing protein [Zongyanglinia huanghaiensis]
MQSSTKSTDQAQSFDILLFDHFSNHCLANTVEPLRAANTLSRKSLYRWRFLTLNGDPVFSSSGMQVAPHGALRDGAGTTLMVMPSYEFRNLDRWETTRGLRDAARRYTRLAGLDTGSWLLASAGLLDGYRATIHWEELTGFAERFPEVNAVRERYVIDGDRITCSGAMAAFDLTMHLIGEDNGQLLAMDVAQLFMTQDSARSHSSRSHTSKTVDRASSIMLAHLERPLAISEVARRVGCTQRTLEHRMQAELKTTPQTVYRRLRLNLARKLVSDTDHPVSEIAGRCGYDNPSALTRAFKAEFSITPRQMRS